MGILLLIAISVTIAISVAIAVCRSLPRLIEHHHLYRAGLNRIDGLLDCRLGWGHVFQLQPLDETARRAVLRQEADARGIFLGDEVMDYMLSRFSRDLGNLMRLLGQLDHYALRTQRAITIPLLKDMLEAE